MSKFTLCALTVGILSVSALADPGPPDPISIDRFSPSVIDFIETPGNIYDMLMPGNPMLGMGWDVGGMMFVHEFDFNYGLIPMADNNDGHSNGEMDPRAAPLIYFSGDDMSMGIPMITDYDNQAMRLQAAGDRFVTNGPATLSPMAVMAGGIPAGIAGPVLPGGAFNFPINLLSANQHRYNEIPSIPPGAFNMYMSPAGGTPMDDMDALELTPFVTQVGAIHDMPIYFTLDAMSPSLGAGLSGADVLLSPPFAPVFGLFAPAVSLGLSPMDEVDALAVWNLDGDEQGTPGVDYALFSLERGSPSLFVGLIGDANYDGVVSADDYGSVQLNFGSVGGVAGVLLGDANRDGVVSADDYGSVQLNFGNMGGMSAADIFVTDFTGMNTLYLPSLAIGMLPTDNVDAIDVEIWFGENAFWEQLLDQVEEGDPVPEPATLSLLVIGGLALLRRRRS